MPNYRLIRVTFSPLSEFQNILTDSERMGSVIKLTVCTLLLVLSLSLTSQGVPQGMSRRGLRLQCQDDYRNCPDGSEFHEEIFSNIMRALLEKRDRFEKRNFVQLPQRQGSNRRRNSNDLEYSDY